MTPDNDLPRFASIISHEVAQPLQVASGYLEMLHSEFGAGLDPTALQWLDQVTEAVDRVRRLVQDMVTFARAGRSDLALEPVDLNIVGEVAVGALRPLITERAAGVEVEALPAVLGDEGQLTEVLEHLIANAVKFVPPGASPRVQVSAQEIAEGVIVSIDDNGPGIPGADRDLVFELFRRGQAEDVPGTGLGLALCRRIVDAHGGRMWIEDSHLGGARVRFLVGVTNVRAVEPPT